VSGLLSSFIVRPTASGTVRSCPVVHDALARKKPPSLPGGFVELARALVVSAASSRHETPAAAGQPSSSSMIACLRKELLFQMQMQ
jgi:hypothetical protein